MPCFFVKKMPKIYTLGPCVDLTPCRVEGDEVEMIVEAATRSWVGVGWRPADATKSCQAFPQVLPSGIKPFFLITKIETKYPYGELNSDMRL